MSRPISAARSAPPHRSPSSSDWDWGKYQISNFKFQISKERLAPVGLVVALLMLAYSAGRTARDYFVTWARDPGLYTAFDVGLRQASEYLAARPAGELLSLSPVDRDWPVIRFAFRDDVSRLKTFNGRRCAVYPAQPASDWTHVSIVAEESSSLRAIRSAFPAADVAAQFKHAGSTYATALHIKQGTAAQIPTGGLAVLDGRIDLLSATMPVPASVRAGEAFTLTLVWQARAASTEDYTVFLHLSPAPGQPPVAQEDAQPCDNSYPTSWWSPGEIIEENHRLAIPPGAAPGQYVLAAGMYNLATGQRLPVSSPAAPPGDQYVLGSINILPKSGD